MAVIEDAGFAGYPASNLSILDLKMIDLPFIAFVRGSPSSDRYNHWITIEQNKTEKGFLVFDNGFPPYTISEAELMSIWSGVGVFVAPREQQSPWLELGSIRFAVFLVLVFIGLLVITVSRRAWGLESRLASFACFGGITFLTATFASIAFFDIPNYKSGVATATAPYTHSIGEVSLEGRCEIRPQ